MLIDTAALFLLHDLKTFNVNHLHIQTNRLYNIVKYFLIY
jgi:hypothetical protein